MYRFHPRNIRIKALLSQGGIGDPLLIRTAFCFRMPDKLFNDPDNPRMFSGNGGGALLDVGCYAVSTARWLFGDEPISASAQAVFHPSGVDIHAVGALRFPGGRLAAIEASFVSALQQTYCVTGTEGAVELPHDAFIPWEKDASYTVREKDKPDGVIETVPGADEYRLMIEHFCDAVSGKCPLLYSPTDSVLNMRVLDALSSSATTGTTATI
jgi:predicted dehydrogenase